MFNKFFNPYKLKKRFSRGVRSATGLVYTNDNSLKDFDWHNRKSNPLISSQNKQNTRETIKVYSALVIFVITLLVMVYEPFFYITDIKITGFQRIHPLNFEESVKGIIDYRKLLILPAQNYFLIDLSQINDILKERFPLQSISTKKIFPKTLEIKIEEKISNVIYDSGKKYYYLDTEGKVIEILRKVGDDEWQENKKITTSTDATGKEISETKVINRIHVPNSHKIIQEMGDYPIVYDQRNLDGEINSVLLEPQIVKEAIVWFNFIKEKTNTNLSYLLVKPEATEVALVTGEGWSILINLNKTVSSQQSFSELEYLLQNKKINRESIKYVDLRFPGKVYWQ